VISDAHVARDLARRQSKRLSPPAVAPVNLAEAIWHRTLALGQEPDDREVLEYLDLCAADRRYVSGRAENERAIHPAESYHGDGVLLELERLGTGRRVQWIAWYRVRDGVLCPPRGLDHESRASLICASARTVVTMRAKVWDAHPGGEWTYRLDPKDRLTILARWGLLP
jgi:hypothetical protein